MSTDSFYARPSFLRGMARVVDLCGTLDRGAYAFGPAAEVDAKAFMSDWEMVAHDMACAFEQTTHYVRERQHASARKR